MADKWMVRFRGETIPYAPRLHKQSTPTQRQQLPSVWIGYDSEAADAEDGFPEVQTMQTYNGNEARVEYVKTGDAFRHFWSIVIRSIPEHLFDYDGNTPVTVPIYCHNWEYDFGMVMKEAPAAWQNQAKMNVFYPGFKDTVTIERSTWNIFVEGGHMIGNAPTLTVVLSRKNVVIATGKPMAIRLRLLDTFPFFPKALGSALKDLGLEKGDRASVIGVDWRRLDYTAVVDAKTEKGEPVQVTKKDFEVYSKGDAVGVWTLGKRIIELHEMEGLTSLAVSGAGYSAKSMQRYLRCPYTGAHGGRAAVQIALDAFHGGRSGRLVHGRITDANVNDFRSSYPSIQKHLPALHSDSTLVYRHHDLSVADFMALAKKYHGFARVSGFESDAYYPSLLSADSKGSIRPVVGAFENIPATAAEIYCGAVFGGVKLTYINEAIFYAPVEGHEEDKPFFDFIERAWVRKNSFAKGTIEYDGAKVQANSGYGKQIEHRGSKVFVTDSLQIPLPNVRPETFETVRNFFLGYHPDFWHDALAEWEQICDSLKTGEDVAGYVDMAGLLNAKPEFGYYAVPQYATWITGHAHARLVLMLRMFDAVKWDTDSATSLLPEDELRRRCSDFPTHLLPDYLQPITFGDDLGNIDMEARHLSGVILGNKRYYLEGEVKKDGKWIPGHKEGHHGMPGVKKEDIRAVLFGEMKNADGQIEYTSKPKPDKIRGAKSWRNVGQFKTPKYKPKYEADHNQDFANGGTYREFAGFKHNETPSD